MFVINKLSIKLFKFIFNLSAIHNKMNAPAILNTSKPDEFFDIQEENSIINSILNEMSTLSG